MCLLAASASGFDSVWLPTCLLYKAQTSVGGEQPIMRGAQLYARLFWGVSLSIMLLSTGLLCAAIGLDVAGPTTPNTLTSFARFFVAERTLTLPGGLTAVSAIASGLPAVASMVCYSAGKSIDYFCARQR